MSHIEKGILQQKKFSIEWKIERFFADCKEVGDTYLSPVFSMRYVDNKMKKWHIEIYPKGVYDEKKEDNAVTSESVALFLHFSSEDVSEVVAVYKVSVLTEKNGVLELENAIDTFKGPNDAWGWKDFFDHSFIKKNGILIDDTLTILCEISFPDATPDIAEIFQHYTFTIEKIGKGFEDYAELLETSQFSDVTFNIQGKEMHLHKAILTCRNSVFKAMFEHQMKESKENVVEITDVDYDVMKELFRFIYSGKVENIENTASGLLIAADKYNVTELKALCEKTLYHNLKIDNVIDYLKLTDTCDTIHLKTLVIKFAADHYKDVIKKPEFADLNGRVMHEIMQAIAEKN